MKTIAIVRTYSICILAFLLVFFCVACTDQPSDDPQNNSDSSIWELTFNGDGYDCANEAGITQDGNVVLLTKSGTYRISGTLNDGQLRVRVPKTEKVTLIFDGFTATCSTSAPVYIESADKVTVRLADGSTNTLTDTDMYVFNGVDTKPNACLYSSEDITFEGNGTLIVNANYNNGIGTKNDLKIKGGVFEIRAVKNALKGNDSVSITGGSILITQCNDGIKTDATEVGRGVLTITGGTINICADDDGLQASQEISVSGGNITVQVLGKAVNCDGIVNISENCLIEK